LIREGEVQEPLWWKFPWKLLEAVVTGAIATGAMTTGSALQGSTCQAIKKPAALVQVARLSQVFAQR